VLGDGAQRQGQVFLNERVPFGAREPLVEVDRGCEGVPLEEFEVVEDDLRERRVNGEAPWAYRIAGSRTVARGSDPWSSRARRSPATVPGTRAAFADCRSCAASYG